jgi:uncharacterized DUF497 family protein
MILFEWDEAKAQRNLRKHGVSFQLARFVFVDPLALTEQDFTTDEEDRWRTIGLVGAATILFVAHTMEERGEDEVVRIVSARRATPRERTRYEQDRKKHIS